MMMVKICRWVRAFAVGAAGGDTTKNGGTKRFCTELLLKKIWIRAYCPKSALIKSADL
ncbi:MAG: hypothetical protein ACLTWO_00745 [Blautia massiliensis (ex Durand et al. 2017)]